MDQYTPELLKSLEKYLHQNVTVDESIEEGTWAYNNNTNNFPDILKKLEYDSKKLVYFYSLVLKKPRTCDFLEKKMKVSLSYNDMWSCTTVFKVLIKDKAKLPLLLNAKYQVTRFTAMWRLENGI